MSVLLLLVACAVEPADRRGEALVLDTIEGYRAWDAVPGWEGRHPGHGEREGWMDVYANPEALEAWGEAALPEGSALVKDNFDDEDAVVPVGSTVMVRAEADWIYARLDEAGSVVLIEREGACLGCHGGEPDERFLR